MPKKKLYWPSKSGKGILGKVGGNELVGKKITVTVG